MSDIPIAELRRLLEAWQGGARFTAPSIEEDLVRAALRALPSLLDAAEERDRLREERDNARATGDEVARLAVSERRTLRAENERLTRHRDKWRATAIAADDDNAARIVTLEAERDAARAEAERLRERYGAACREIDALNQVRREVAGHRHEDEDRLAAVESAARGLLEAVKAYAMASPTDDDAQRDARIGMWSAMVPLYQLLKERDDA